MLIIITERILPNMRINQLKSGIILSYLSQAVAVLIGLLYTPVMLRLVGQNEYGLYQLSASVVAYLGLLNFGMGSAYIRYYARYKAVNNSEKIAKLNGMFMIVFCILGLVVVMAGIVLAQNVGLIFKRSLSPSELHTAKVLMLILVFNMAVSFPCSVFNSYVTANEQYVFQRVLSILNSLCGPFLTLPLLIMGYKSVAMVSVSTVLSLAAFIVTMVFCRRKLGMKFCFKDFNFNLLKDIWIFSFFIFLNMIIDQANWTVDKFVLGIFRGVAAVAVYGVAGQLNTYFIQFSVSISSVFVPRVNRLVAEADDNTELTKLFIKVGRAQFVIVALIVTGLIFFGRQFITAWAGSGYENAYYITLLLVIPASVSLIQNLGIEIQRAKNMHKFRSVVYIIIAAINVACSIPLAKFYGGIGAAWGTCGAMIIGNGLIMNVYYHKKIGLDIIRFWREIGKFIPSLIIPILCGTVIMKFIPMEKMIYVLLWAVIYTVIYCISVYLLGLNKNEKNTIIFPLKRIFIKNNS